MYGRKTQEALEQKRRVKQVDEESQFDFRPIVLKQSEDILRRRDNMNSDR